MKLRNKTFSKIPFYGSVGWGSEGTRKNYSYELLRFFRKVFGNDWIDRCERKKERDVKKIRKEQFIAYWKTRNTYSKQKTTRAALMLYFRGHNPCLFEEIKRARVSRKGNFVKKILSEGQYEDLIAELARSDQNGESPFYTVLSFRQPHNDHQDHEACRA